MACNEKLTNRIREALAHLPGVAEKRMFRGVTFMVNGKMCLSAGDDRMMCRIDPLLHETLIAKEGCTTVTMGGRAYRGYVYISEESIRKKADFDYWVGLALAFNKKAKAARKK
jgi:TfoX/Sxy family transcriptional regulator of competence genes